jgi:transcriptional regulator with XRE-family HTH domain
MKKSVTLTELAKKCNISPSQLSLIETGKIDPRLGIIGRICEELDIKLYELFIDSSANLSTKEAKLEINKIRKAFMVRAKR